MAVDVLTEIVIDRRRDQVAAYAATPRIMRTAEGPFPMETSYEWRDTGASATRMTLRNCGEPVAFSRLFALFMAGAMRRANTKDLAKLKRILEG
jgi:hypothetical protein